ncbi:LRR receptor-like serine/threonine-protein kinase HSL2 [Panicum miliaceum]|uniref:LRR receptor-like serine/threonine-protein kinase HSL2 n=1 Tax=Panicum miliaceum TaxID=4540 RepID=A0A3L6S1A9_PANMI|nr:LRR receptor-like serine/threonine-protein kinase HSL2 [Panicum miliaceum]
MSRSDTSCLSLLLVVLFLLLVTGGCRSQRAAAAGDREALLAAKREWGTPPQLASWDPAAAPDHCNWTGVTCATGGGGVVTGITLPRFNLTGTVPAAVRALKSLARLDLSYNNLTGAFPAAALHACAGLRFLDLSNNQFSGPLPRDIDGLSPAMEHLNLSVNGFDGEVPPAVARLTALKSLLLDTNRFTGAYPAAEISNLAGLEILTLADNAFPPAPVPVEFAKLTNLTYLLMDNMNLIGDIPEAFSSLTELTVFSLASNKLTGSIPAWVLQHTNLQKIYLFTNNLSGELPRNVTAMRLVEFDVSTNQLTGDIPEAFGDLKNLTFLSLYKNKFTGAIPATIGLLPRLRDIRIQDNQFSGELPPELGKHSPFANLDVGNNNLSGRLPEWLCASGTLYNIDAFNNNFSGEFPAKLSDCVTINNLMFYNNRFSCDFPAKVWSFPELTTVMIQNNSFTGTLPSEISSKISRIEMGNDIFSGSVPTSATGLLTFLAENNRLAGELPPDMSKLSNLTDFSVPGNRITGSIPTSIKLLQKLNSLNLSGNKISGTIPPGSIGLLRALTILDLSGNELAGDIPPDMGQLHLSSLNMSLNQFTGEVPPLLQIPAYSRSFLGNHLCASAADWGTNLPTCPGGARDELSRVLIILFSLLGGAVLIGCVGVAWLLFRRRKESHEVTDWKMTSFTPLDFTESDVLRGIREENVIVSGGSGKVYRIHLGRDEEGGGRMVAVKRIWNSRKVDEKLDKEFESEMKVLGSIRRNNIVKLLCCISSQDAKLLVYEYMENGSLDRWLHHRDREGAPAPLDWPTRLAIAVDAARGLSYMHHGCAQPVVHRDVKSSNMPKVADFGLARMLAKAGEPESVSAIGGTFGYMPPAHMLIWRRIVCRIRVQVKGEREGGRLQLRRRPAYQEGPPFDDVADVEIRDDTACLQDVLSVFTLGVICTGEEPQARPSMKDVLQQLIRCCRVPAEAETCRVE